MVTSSTAQGLLRRLCKGVQTCPFQTPPDGVIPLESLQTVESELSRRGFLGITRHPNTFPLWFIAETERNVMLWRNSYSVADAALFDFWVNVEELITKRLRSIERPTSSSRFTYNALTSCPSDYDDPDAGASDRIYLENLTAILSSLLPYLQELAQIAGELQQRRGSSRPQVILPYAASGQS